MVATGCCWLLDDCCLWLEIRWLLLVSCLLNDCWRRSLWLYSGYWLFAAKSIFWAKKSEYFQDIDDLRLRQFCRRKSLWILSEYWWFAAETILQAKNSLNIFRILMGCCSDNFAGEKVFEYFQDIDDLGLGQFCWRKSLWMFSPRCWGTLVTTSFEIVLEYFQSKDWIPEFWWEESGRKFRLGEKG